MVELAMEATVAIKALRRECAPLYAAAIRSGDAAVIEKTENLSTTLWVAQLQAPSARRSRRGRRARERDGGCMTPKLLQCRFEGCKRAPAFDDQPFCADHRLRWAVREPVERTEPEWLRRAHTVGLPAKDMTGSAA